MLLRKCVSRRSKPERRVTYTFALMLGHGELSGELSGYNFDQRETCLEKVALAVRRLIVK